MSGEEGREVSAVIALPLKAVNGVDNVSEALGYSSTVVECLFVKFCCCQRK